jgi:transcription initiation factor IIE alpha subunit
MKTKADEIALKVGIYLKCSNTLLLYFKERGHVMWQSVRREDNHQTFI